MNEAVDRFLKGMNLSQQAAADMLKVTQPTVSEWLRGDRPVPHGTCADMERLSSAAVLATDVRRDERWHRIPDKAWPCKAGRPVLDVARASAA